MGTNVGAVILGQIFTPGFRLVMQVVKCKQCHWATTTKEELERHIEKHHTDNMRWW